LPALNLLSENKHITACCSEVSTNKYRTTIWLSDIYLCFALSLQLPDPLFGLLFDEVAGGAVGAARDYVVYEACQL
jgi:hypothetical protein